MNDIIIMKELLAFLRRLRNFIKENEKLDIINYLDILIIDLEKAIKENEKVKQNDYEFEL